MLCFATGVAARHQTGARGAGASGMQITEALRIQHVMQRRLGKQLKMQRDLQLRIEAQGKVLKRMMENHLKGSRNATETQEVDDVSPFSGHDDDAFDNLHLPFRDGISCSDDDVFTSKMSY
ncbi:hypothetical protein D1007_17903 [Hordeum vulgare]|nr:hypothetical protein D1007_17903 [Hordeum vulgare]